MNKKKLCLVLLAVILIVSAWITPALAYFTAYTRARGGYTVDISWKDGKLLSAVITPDGDGKYTVRYGEKRKKVSFKAGKPFIFK